MLCTALTVDHPFMSANIELARQNMINNQVRTWDVLSLDVLDMLATVRREDFVPAPFRHLAFADMSIPLDHGEVMMKPVVEGRLLQAVAPGPDDEVLEIGTGSGYMTACLASMAAHVTSVDLYPDFTATAGAALEKAGIDNVTLAIGEAVHDYAPGRPFDAVVVTGAVPAIGERFVSWLKPGGRAFIVHGSSPLMEAVLVHREGDAQWRQESLFETDLPWLVSAAPAPRFTL